MMPVRKFRSLREMEDALWRGSGDPSLPDAIARVWDFADRISRRTFPPGVYKHRSIDEAQRLRDIWEEINFRAFWERRSVSIDGEPKHTPLDSAR
jgi:hypothetical protein